MLDKALDSFIELKNPFHFYSFGENNVQNIEGVLQACRIPRPLPYKLVLPSWRLVSVNKISEGSYGEIYRCDDRIMKVIVVFGTLKDEPERCLDIEESVSDAMCTRYLSMLTHTGVFRAPNFPYCHSIDLVRGNPPEAIVEAWTKYVDDLAPEETTHFRPDRYARDSLFLVIEMEYCGRNLLSQGSLRGIQLVSLILQTASSLAVAECSFKFEHRDLHLGNWMFKKTEESHMTYKTDTWSWKIPTFNVKAFIIDFTLSRIEVDERVFAMDLSNLIESSDNDQSNTGIMDHTTIYKRMTDELSGDFKRYFPKTNIWFVKYLIESMSLMLETNLNSPEEILTTTDEIALYILYKLRNNIELYSNTLDFIKNELFDVFADF